MKKITKLKIDPSRRQVIGYFDGEEVIRVYADGIQSAMSLPVNLNNAQLLVGLYADAIAAYRSL